MGLPMVEMDDLWVPKKAPMETTREIKMEYLIWDKMKDCSMVCTKGL